MALPNPAHRHEFLFEAFIAAAQVHAKLGHSVQDRAIALDMANVHGAHLARAEMREMSERAANERLFAEIVQVKLDSYELEAV